MPYNLLGASTSATQYFITRGHAKTTAEMQVSASYVDLNSSTFAIYAYPPDEYTPTFGTSSVPFISNPGLFGVTRRIQRIQINNFDAVSDSVQITYGTSGNAYGSYVPTYITNPITVPPNYSWNYEDTYGWYLNDPSGQQCAGQAVINVSGSNSPNVILNGKCLYSGTAITSITLSGSLATVSQTSHGYKTGDVVVISGATGQTGVNALWVITITGANSYTFATSLTGSVTGSPVVMFWFSGANSYNPTKILNVVHTGVGLYTCTFTNTQATAFYGVFASASSATFGINGTPTVTNFVLTFANVEQTSYFCVQLFGVV